MHISVTGHGIETSETLREFVSDKLERMDRFASGISKIQVIIRAEPKGGRRVEVICHLSGGKTAVARAEHTDAYAAVDLVADKLQRQLVKLSGQRREGRSGIHRSRRARGGGLADLPAADADSED